MKKKMSKLSKLFFLFALTTFFISLSDAYMAYFVPIVIMAAGYSATSMGLLYGSSSIFGAIFDLILARVLRNTHYKRMYLYTIVLAACFPILLFTNSIFWFYLLAMATWGLYYNLFMFGYFDFVAREEKMADHSGSFSKLYMFRNLGLVIGPLLAAQIAFIRIPQAQLIIPLIASSIALLLLFILGTVSRKKELVKVANIGKPFEIKVDKPMPFSIWKKVGMRMWPVLILVLFVSLVDGIFWTVIPIIGTIAPDFTHLSSVLLIVTIVPAFLVARLVTNFTHKYGQKRTAFFSFLFSNLLLLPIGYFTNVYLVLIFVFLSTTFSAMVYPCVAGAVADYLKESRKYDGQILTARDFFANVGFAIGPLVAGIFVDVIGSLMIFSYISLVGIVVSLLLLVFSPAEIDFHDSSIQKSS